MSEVKLLLGDCLELMREIPDQSIDAVITDPPYLTTDNDWDSTEVINIEWCNQIFRIANNSSSIYVWCGIGEKSQSLIRWFPLLSSVFYFKDLITWKKQRGIGMRKGWLYTREELMWFVKDKNHFKWNAELQYGNDKRAFTLPNNKSKFRRLTNVWTDIREINQSIAKNSEVCIHPAQKPLKAIERILTLHTNAGDTIIDPFMGSGTTGVACVKLNRNFIGMEISPDYFAIAQRRIAEAQAQIHLF